MRFHTALVDAAGSPRTSRMYRSLVGEVRLCMVQVWGKQLLDRKAIHAEHQGILDAIDAGDPVLAVKRIDLHLSGVRERLAGSFAVQTGSFAVRTASFADSAARTLAGSEHLPLSLHPGRVLRMQSALANWECQGRDGEAGT